MKYERQSGAHSKFLLTYHLIWCVKYRCTVLTNKVGDRLKEMVTEILKEKGCEVVAIETDVDHIHVVFRAKPSEELSNIKLQRKVRWLAAGSG